MRARPALAAAMRSDLFAPLIGALERIDSGRPNLLPVLTYHRVTPVERADGYPGLISAEPEAFAQQMAFVARRYRAIALGELLEARNAGRRLAPGSVMVTFDDAYRDFAEHAWPVLRAHGIPVTLFVPTAYPGRPEQSFWWDWLYAAVDGARPGAVLETPAASLRLRSAADRMDAFRHIRTAVKALPHDDGMQLVASIAGQLDCPSPAGMVLDWPALRQLAADGVALAPHSRSHPLLDRVEVGRLDEELMGSRSDLDDQIGTTPPVLAYPSGAQSGAVRAAVERLGFRIAFGTTRGVNDLDVADWLSLRRINVGSRSSLNAIRAQLGRWALLWSR
jgi:peptidoglycan/xylan/chitin deacetylase (PgdA/CDA1 family)